MVVIAGCARFTEFLTTYWLMARFHSTLPTERPKVQPSIPDQARHNDGERLAPIACNQSASADSFRGLMPFLPSVPAVRSEADQSALSLPYFPQPFSGQAKRALRPASAFRRGIAELTSPVPSLRAAPVWRRRRPKPLPARCAARFPAKSDAIRTVAERAKSA